MSDIDQQAVFDRLPLSAEQRKKLYEAITGVAAQRDSVIPSDNSALPGSPVEPDRTHDHPVDSQSLKKH